jgi:hypothetical protein
MIIIIVIAFTLQALGSFLGPLIRRPFQRLPEPTEEATPRGLHATPVHFTSAHSTARDPTSRHPTPH